MKLMVLRGLPASGKTTYARDLIAQGWKRVNRDDLRQMLDSGFYTPENEIVIKVIRDRIIRLASYRYNIVVDDTNLKSSDIEHFEKLAKELELDLEVNDSFLTDVSLEECIRRDAARARPIGHEVIKKLYLDFLDDTVTASK